MYSSRFIHAKLCIVSEVHKPMKNFLKNGAKNTKISDFASAA
jgi:hypothetical protein